MKILFIIDTLKKGGKEKQLVGLIKNLYKKNQIHIICFSNIIEYEAIRELPVTLTIIKKRKKSFASFKAVYKACKTFSPDIIHSWDVISSLHVIPSSVLLRIKIVNGCIRGSAKRALFSKYKMLANFTFLFSRIVVANSNAGLRSLNKKENSKYKVVKNGFDFEDLMKNETAEKVRMQYNINTPFVIGMVSNFRVGKDYDTFFSSAVKLLKERSDVTFVAIGDGPTFPKYHQNYKEYENIIFTGKLSNANSLINIFTIGVLLSITCKEHGEGISNSIMEYLAHYKPVITTESGGNSEIVYHNKNGFVIPQKDGQAFIKQIEILLSDGVLRAAFGEMGRKLLVDNFSFSTVEKQYLNIYSSLV